MDFVERFLQYTKTSEAPPIFRKWVAISMVSACMGRRVWTTTTDPNAPFYPNLFVLLVAEPGVGKSLPLSNARKLMKEVAENTQAFRLGPDQITPESLAEELASMNVGQDWEDKDTPPQGEKQPAEMALFLDEFGDFVKADSKNFTDHITFLSGLYNSPESYEKKTKTAGDDNIYKPCLNIIAGTQPAWFGAAFTQMSMGQGFPARLFLVYSSDRQKKSPFREYPNEDKIRRELIGALEERTKIAGFMDWSEEAKERYADLYMDDVPPKPTEPLLASYCERRGFYLAKLSMVAAANNGAKHRIDHEDVDTAHGWMLEIEQEMHKALLYAGGNRDRGVEASILSELKAVHGSKVHRSQVMRIAARYLDSFRRPGILRSLEDEQKLKRINPMEREDDPIYRITDKAEEV